MSAGACAAVADRYTVVWSDRAEQDLLGVLQYLAGANPEAAARLLDRVRRKAASLDRFPHRGRIVPELLPFQIRTYRELVVPPYRLPYRIDGRTVIVVAFLDSRRDLESLILARLVEPRRGT